MKLPDFTNYSFERREVIISDEFDFDIFNLCKDGEYVGNFYAKDENIERRFRDAKRNHFILTSIGVMI